MLLQNGATYAADKAVDGLMNTQAHGVCGGKSRWLELELNGKYLVQTVTIYQTKDGANSYRFRMDQTKVRIYIRNTFSIIIIFLILRITFINTK